jgi:hypothetical protein
MESIQGLLETIGAAERDEKIIQFRGVFRPTPGPMRAEAR